MTDDIDIVVVPRDRLSMFGPCIDAIYAHTRGTFRVIVVAGGADRSTREFLSHLQAKKDNLDNVFVDRLLTQAESRNLGLASCRHRFCVVLENDTIVHEGWLSPLVDCLREERAAVATPLLWWNRGLHAAGGSFEERQVGDAKAFNHRVNYSEIHRRQVDYPENHCILLDRQRLVGDRIFDDVEPFDVDLGLTARERGLTVFLEPRSEATYRPPPPLKLSDMPIFKQRWDWATWEASNRRFAQKWGVRYDTSLKRASYRRHRLKLGLASWHATKLTVAASNLAFAVANRVETFVTQRPRLQRAAGRFFRTHAAN